MAADRAQAVRRQPRFARSAQIRAGSRGLLRDRPGDRQFWRRLRADRDGERGTDQGLARGQAAVAGEGLVGRLTEVGSRAARVLLITDLNSRIPVVVEKSHANAMLAGDNSQRPRLFYVGQPDTIKIGDRILTSGEGGVFPPGLPVGMVAALEPGGARVEPYVELSQLGYVLIVDYGLSGALPRPVPVATRPVRRKPAAAD